MNRSIVLMVCCGAAVLFGAVQGVGIWQKHEALEEDLARAENERMVAAEVAAPSLKWPTTAWTAKWEIAPNGKWEIASGSQDSLPACGVTTPARVTGENLTAAKQSGDYLTTVVTSRPLLTTSGLGETCMKCCPDTAPKADSKSIERLEWEQDNTNHLIAERLVRLENFRDALLAAPVAKDPEAESTMRTLIVVIGSVVGVWGAVLLFALGLHRRFCPRVGDR